MEICKIMKDNKYLQSNCKPKLSQWKKEYKVSTTMKSLSDY